LDSRDHDAQLRRHRPCARRRTLGRAVEHGRGADFQRFAHLRIWMVHVIETPDVPGLAHGASQSSLWTDRTAVHRKTTTTLPFYASRPDPPSRGHRFRLPPTLDVLVGYIVGSHLGRIEASAPSGGPSRNWIWSSSPPARRHRR